MRVEHKLKLLVFSLLMVIALSAFTAGQEPKSLLATAKGSGLLKLGQEQFKIYSVVIKLVDDGKVEISLVSDITVFVSGTWSRGDESQKTIKLNITGTASGGGIEASGTLLLRADGKSIDQLRLQGASKTTKRNIGVSFQAD